MHSCKVDITSILLAGSRNYPDSLRQNRPFAAARRNEKTLLCPESCLLRQLAYINTRWGTRVSNGGRTASLDRVAPQSDVNDGSGEPAFTREIVRKTAEIVVCSSTHKSVYSDDSFFIILFRICDFNARRWTSPQILGGGGFESDLLSHNTTRSDATRNRRWKRVPPWFLGKALLEATYKF